MGYKRSMFHKSSSSLGKKFLSGLIVGGVLGTAYGAKKMVDKVGEISNDAKPTGDEEIGLGWKIFIHVFLFFSCPFSSTHLLIFFPFKNSATLITVKFESCL